MWRNRAKHHSRSIAQERRQRTERDLQCLKRELSKKLTGLEPVVQEYVVPELFTRCHCKRSIKLLVEDKEIYASKQILKLASPVFLNMFESDFREKNMESIQLPGKTCQEVVLLLSCLYPNILEQIEDDPIEHEKDIVTTSSLGEAGREAWVNIERNLRGKTEFQVGNWFGTAKELRDVFDKLHVESVSVNRKTGSGTVQFDNTVSALLAYCLDGKVFNGNPLEVKLLNESESAEEVLDGLSFPTMFDEAEDAVTMDTWQCTKVHLTAQEKIVLLLKLADEYQMEAVLRLCGEKYLYWYNESSKDNKEIPADNILKLLHLAEKYNLQSLHKELSEKAVTIKLKLLQNEPLFEKLSANTRFKICHSKLLKIGQYDGNIREETDDKKCTVRSKSNITRALKVDNGAFIDGTNPYMTMVIQVGSDKLYASREVLALSSQVLKDRMETNDDQEPLEFPDSNKDDFLCLLRSIHPNFEPTVNRKNVRRLLKLAKEFQLHKLFDDCDVVLNFEFTDLNAKAIQDANKVMGYDPYQDVISTRIKTAREFLSLAVQYKLPNLQASCCNTLSTLKYKQLMSFVVENEERIPLDVLVNIMYSRILSLEDKIPSHRLKTSYSNSPEDAVEKEMSLVPQPFREQTEYDVCLVVQGESLYIDEDVLALASPFFKKELEKQNFQHSPVIVCTGKKIDGVISFLNCLHPNILAKVNEANAMNILHFVEEFEMSALSKVCEDSLIKTCTEKMSAANMVDYIAKAEKYKMHRLRLTCENTLAKMCGESTNSWRTSALGNAALNIILNSQLYDEFYSPYYCSSDDSY